MENLTGEIIDSKNPSLSRIDRKITPAFYYANTVTKDRTDQIVVYQEVAKEKLNRYLAHELFGHAVCSHVQNVVIQNGEKFERNGLALVHQRTGNSKHEVESEGFMEAISYGVLKEAGLSAPLASISLPYHVSMLNAIFVEQMVGRKNVLDHLVYNQGNLIEQFNAPVQEDYFEQLAVHSRHAYSHFNNFKSDLEASCHLQKQYQKKMK